MPHGEEKVSTQNSKCRLTRCWPLTCDMSVNKGILPIINLLPLYTYLSLVFGLVDKLLGSSVTYVTKKTEILSDGSRVLVSVFRGKKEQFHSAETILTGS